MSFGNFLYQVEGIGALPDASLYTDKYWCVLTGDSQYQGITYKSDGTNWIYVDGCVTYGPGTSYATVDDLPENCVFIAPNGGVYLKQGETITPVSAWLVDGVLYITVTGENINVDDPSLKINVDETNFIDVDENNNILVDEA